MEPGYVLALTTGLIGGFGHCIGMCGPLVASYTLHSASPTRINPANTFLPHLLYNSGRVATYGLIGAAMGWTGSFLNLAGRLAHIQDGVALLAGIIMIVLGFNIMGFGGSVGWIESNNTPVLLAARRAIASTSPARYLLLGLILGFLPCGLSYTIFIAAAGTGNAVSGMITALLFGFGTLTALFLFGIVVSSLSAAARGRIHRAGGFLVVVMGVYYLYKGARLYAGL